MWGVALVALQQIIDLDVTRGGLEVAAPAVPSRRYQVALAVIAGILQAAGG